MTDDGAGGVRSGTGTRRGRRYRMTSSAAGTEITLAPEHGNGEMTKGEDGQPEHVWTSMNPGVNVKAVLSQRATGSLLKVPDPPPTHRDRTSTR